MLSISLPYHQHFHHLILERLNTFRIRRRRTDGQGIFPSFEYICRGCILGAAINFMAKL